MNQRIGVETHRISPYIIEPIIVHPSINQKLNERTEWDVSDLCLFQPASIPDEIRHGEMTCRICYCLEGSRISFQK